MERMTEFWKNTAIENYRKTIHNYRKLVIRGDKVMYYENIHTWCKNFLRTFVTSWGIEIFYSNYCLLLDPKQTVIGFFSAFSTAVCGDKSYLND